MQGTDHVSTPTSGLVWDDAFIYAGALWSFPASSRLEYKLMSMAKGTLVMLLKEMQPSRRHIALSNNDICNSTDLLSAIEPLFRTAIH